MVFTEFHFEFAGQNSRDYGLIIANVNTSEFTQSSGEFSPNYLFNRKNRKNYLINDDYSSSRLSIPVDIVVDSDIALTNTEIKRIEKWLFCSNRFRKLYIDTADDESEYTYEFIDSSLYRLYLNCRFINPSKITNGNGEIVGWTATLDCDSHEFTQDPITQRFPLTGETKRFVVTTDNVDTDYIYPIVKITLGNTGGDFSIVNTSDNFARETAFKSIPRNTILTMNSEINTITEGYYDKFSGMNFIRLLDGENYFHVTGDVVSIEFTFSNRRML